MSPPIDLSVDMSAVNEIDLQISYAKLFPLIAKDFLAIADFHTMMGTAFAPEPTHKVQYIPSTSGASSLASAYKTVLENGELARRGLIQSLEAIGK